MSNDYWQDRWQDDTNALEEELGFMQEAALDERDKLIDEMARADEKRQQLEDAATKALDHIRQARYRLFDGARGQASRDLIDELLQFAERELRVGLNEKGDRRDAVTERVTDRA